MDRPTRYLLLIAGLAVALAANLFARGVGVGIQAYRAEWIWRPLAKGIPVKLLPAAGAAGLLVVLIWWLCREGRWERMPGWGRALSLIGLVLVTFALQCAVINAVGEPWVAPGAIIASPVSTTYFAISRDVHSVTGYLASYHLIMPGLPYHAATHPPGLTLFFWAVRRVCEAVTPASALGSPVVAQVQWYAEKLGVGFPPSDAVAAIVSALLLALAGSSSIIPAYVLARRLAGARAGLLAACLMASIPSLLLLPASSDQLVLFFAVRVVCLAYLAWKSDRLWVAGFAGVALAVGAFVSLGLLAIGAWLAVWAVLGWARSRGRGSATSSVPLHEPPGTTDVILSGARDHAVWQDERRGSSASRLAADGSEALRLRMTDRRESSVRPPRLLTHLMVALLGFVSLYVVLFLTTGYRAWTVAYIGLFAHRQATTVEFPRTYWKWVLINPVEMAVFAGLALAIAALWAAPAMRSPESRPLRLFLLSWLIVLVVLDVSGTVRAEVGRIWLFLMWPLALAGGERLSRAPRYATALPLLVLMQLGQALVMRGYLTMYDIF